MRNFTSLMLVLLLAFFLSGLAVAEEKTSELKPQTKCPVMGGDVNKEVFTDHDGQRIYFCCSECIKEFKKDPDKYLAKIKKNGETTMDLKDCAKCGHPKGSEKCCHKNTKARSNCGQSQKSSSCCSKGTAKI
ncbi:hypothetical protein ACFL27_13465 [candidate division CSSED10-310 bacterium]|uniref:TRASH domain-containing protein n=1 Tax=candidate division CSSED10-310 bacterium TaxID=2855610 RepID=A0ABV6YYC6_UNCC1